ncbi:MAG: dephospho-CoA kinase [Candidatus Wallbacteria bacterium]|nr:dephospho-CoA kinase [Candidatus Wallbacteria bacterium]
MPVVGITGRAGSGKSTVSRILRSSGYIVIDVDRVGHIALRDHSVKDRIRGLFGDSVFDESGKIDRSVLGGMVFGNPGKMAGLNGIVWPCMKQRLVLMVRAACEKSNGKPVFVDAAVLFQAGFSEVCDKVVKIEADDEIRAGRLAERSGPEKAAKIMESQKDMENGISACDFIIGNNGSIEDLRTEVGRVACEVTGKR